MDLIEKAQQAILDSQVPIGSEDHRIYSSVETWQDLLDFKDKLIADHEINPINAGVWRSFWGLLWKPDPTVPRGEFQIRMRLFNPHPNLPIGHTPDDYCPACGRYLPCGCDYQIMGKHNKETSMKEFYEPEKSLEKHLEEALEKARALYKEPSTYMPATRYLELREAIIAFYNKAAKDTFKERV